MMGQIANDMAEGKRTYFLKVQSKYVRVRTKYYYKIRTHIPAEYREWYSSIEFSV